MHILQELLPQSQSKTSSVSFINFCLFQMPRRKVNPSHTPWRSKVISCICNLRVFIDVEISMFRTVFVFCFYTRICVITLCKIGILCSCYDIVCSLVF